MYKSVCSVYSVQWFTYSKTVHQRWALILKKGSKIRGRILHWVPELFREMFGLVSRKIEDCFNESNSFVSATTRNNREFHKSHIKSNILEFWSGFVQHQTKHFAKYFGNSMVNTSSDTQLSKEIERELLVLWWAL